MTHVSSEVTETPHGSSKRAWFYLAASAIVLSLFAFAIVVGNVAAGAPPEADENVWAHLFQVAMAAQLPLFLIYLALADWARRRLAILLLVAQIVAAAAAFAALAWSGY